jgi:hypothetical protein
LKRRLALGPRAHVGESHRAAVRTEAEAFRIGTRQKLGDELENIDLRQLAGLADAPQPAAVGPYAEGPGFEGHILAQPYRQAETADLEEH